jgi:hypothetical protein
MAGHDELLEIEHEGWRALSTAEGAAYYAGRLADDALMAFPFGLLDRAQALQAMAEAAPWRTYEIRDAIVVPLTDDCGIVVYAVGAQRVGDEPFSAIVSSTYVRRGGEWKLVFHQQSFGT